MKKPPPAEGGGFGSSQQVGRVTRGIVAPRLRYDDLVRANVRAAPLLPKETDMPAYHIEFISGNTTRVEAPNGLNVHEQWVEAGIDGSAHPLFLCPVSKVMYIKQVDDDAPTQGQAQ